MTPSSQSRLTRAVLCSVFCLCVASPLLAQRSDRAIISGAVTDQQGAAVPGATVTVRNEATGVDTVLVTNHAGAYTTPPLVLGRYSVTVDLTGFKKSVSEGILLEGGQIARDCTPGTRTCRCQLPFAPHSLTGTLAQSPPSLATNS